MKVNSAEFIRGVVGENEVLEEKFPQVAFIGRSNVGKSSVINTLTGKKDLAKTSSFPGRTQQINVFLINKVVYLLDLPGYGFAKGNKDLQQGIQQLIYWYLFQSPYEQKKVVLIIDAFVGPTQTDMEMLHSLKEAGKEVVVVANKIDKLKKTKAASQLKEIASSIGKYKVIPYSAEKKIGIAELAKELLS